MRSRCVPLIVALSLAPVALSWGAPVPRHPPAPQLSADVLIGTWKYSWCNWTDGEITYYRDQTYRSSHSTNGPHYIGFWHVREGVVTLEEYWFNPETNEVRGGGPLRYTFTLAPDAAGWAGLTPTGGRVVLSKE